MSKAAHKVLRICLFCLAVHGALAASVFCEAAAPYAAVTDEISFESRIASLEREIAALHHETGRLDSDCDDGACESCNHGCRSEGWTGGAELTFLQPQSHFRGIDLFGLGLGLVNPLNADFDFEVGPRFWFGYDNAEDLEWRFTYWTIDADSNSTGNLVSEFISAETIDFEHRYSETLFNTEVQFTVGARYASYEDLANVIFGGATFREFEGGGATIGLWMERPFASYGISIVGGVRGSYLYGRHTSIRTVPGGVAGPPSNTNKPLPIVEAQLGAQWERVREDNSRLFARVGFESQKWDLPGMDVYLLYGDPGFIGGTFAVGLDR